jgi:hypothetical protein
MSARLPGSLTLALGLGLLAAVGVSGGIARPALYDGVATAEPYRYVVGSPSAAGGALAASVSLPVVGGQSPAVAVATGENPPQAQLLAVPGAFWVTAGTEAVAVSIRPVSPGPLPEGRSLVGNAYRITVTDQSGRALAIRPSVDVTVVLRAPRATSPSAMLRRGASTWERLDIQPTGLPELYSVAGLTALGEFALVGSPSILPGGPPSLATYGLLAAVLGIGAVVLWVGFREQRARQSG